MTPSTCSGMGSSASTASTSRPLAASSATDAKVRAVGQSVCRCVPSLLARIDERDDLDIGIVEIGAYVEVVDAPEADEGGSYRSVIGIKGRRHRRNTIREPPQRPPNRRQGTCCLPVDSVRRRNWVQPR